MKRLRVIVPGILLMGLASALYAFAYEDTARVWLSIMSGPLSSLRGYTRFDPNSWLIPVILTLFYATGALMDALKQKKWSWFVSVTFLFIWFFTGLLVTIYFRA